MGTVRAGLLPLGLAAIAYVCAGDGVAGPPSPEATAQRCAAAKIKAAGKKAHAKALCYAKAAAAGVPVSQACLDKAEAQFSAAFANAEEKASKSGGCVTQSDVADVENRVDMFVSDVVSALPGTTTTTTTTTTTVDPNACGFRDGGICGGFCAQGSCTPKYHCQCGSPCGTAPPVEVCDCSVTATTSCVCSGRCCTLCSTTTTNTTTTTTLG